MGYDAWVTVGILVVILALLARTRIAPDVLLMGALTLLIVVPSPTEDGWRLGVLTVGDALSGLRNPGMVTVGVLFVVVAGLRETGGINWIVHRVLGRPRSLWSAQVRVILPVVGMSAFLNNTPVVAMMIPAVSEWAKKLQRPVSKFMIPLSYAAILGGTCTLIGTSTNLVVNGMVLEEMGPEHGLGMFDITWVGLPCALIGAAYLMLVGHWLLPGRKSAIGGMEDTRQYTVEMVVESGSPLVGQTIGGAGLRNLPGMYLVEIDRMGTMLAAVGPDEKLLANDQLVFAGVVESVVDLQKIRGLKPATDQVFKLDAPRSQRCLIEAVVSNTCPIIGKSIKEGRFRSIYNAAVIAVARNGERLSGKIGEIVLRPGDTLLLEAHQSFAHQQRNSRDFFLVSEVTNSTPLRHEKALTAVLILAGMVVLAATGWMSMLQAAMLAAGLMIITRCCSSSTARRSVDWQVLVVIAAAFGLGRALEVSGAAEAIAGGLLDVAGTHPLMVLIVVYGITTLFTELITNNAAAVLVYPIAIATAHQIGVSPMPFVVTIMMGASASFATPLGYQTNLMVYGPGGYKFSDYFKIGAPMNLLMWAMTVTLAPMFFPFHPAG